MQLTIFIYTFLFILFLFKKYYFLSVFLLLSIPITIYIVKYLKQSKIYNYSLKINEAKKAFKNGKNYSPFLNINTEPWYIINLIPGISRLSAKKVAAYTKKKKIETFVEFVNLAQIEPVLYDLIKNIIIL